MIFTLLLLTVLAAVAAWWLAGQGLAARPWLETGPMDAAPGLARPRIPAAKIGLGLFIAVAASLLVLLVSAYSIRMELADWSPPPRPVLLWANTGVLVLSSLALHRARVAACRGQVDEVRDGLLVGGLTAVLFLAGQIMAWRQLSEGGYLPAANPAHAFFYLITGAHGLHVLGGLVALGRAGGRLRRPVEMDRLRLGVELCATYWHFLLVAWLVLFSLLAFAPAFGWVQAICSAPFR